MRLNKYISNSGLCSRRNADQLIIEKRVKINGNIVEELATDVGEEDIVEVDGKILKLEEEKVYIVLNKPKGYITTVKEQFGRPCIFDIVKENVKLFPVGRLDKDTEGLIFLTNDGDLANKIIHPRNKIIKRYIVTVNQKITKEQIEKLQNGVDIGDYITRTAKVKLLDAKNLQIEISEGKNRQVRKMCAAVGIKVCDLKRTKIGNFELKGIEVGKYKKITKEELEEIFK